MTLSPVKRVVLEILLLSDKPARAVQIAKETGNQLNSTMMHLIWLIRAGYAFAPEKGQYAITEKGKRVLGIPEDTSENAKVILKQLEKEKAFHFYADMEKPLDLYADGIQDFLEKIPALTAQSLEFHIGRRDFENWFNSLGDVELSKKLALLRERKLVGEHLREKLNEIITNRCATLSKLL